MKILRIGLLVLTTLLVVAVATVYVLLATTGGSRWLLNTVLPMVSEELTVDGIDGTLTGPLRLDGVHLASASIDLTVARATLDWKPRRLLSRELDIVQLEVEGVRYRPIGPPAETTESPLPLALTDIRLPLRVRLAGLNVRDVQLELGETPIVVNDAVLAATFDEDGLRIERLELKAPQGGAALSGTLKPEGDYPLDASLDWSWTQAELPLQGQGSIGGTLRKLEITHALAKPFAVNVTGNVHLDRAVARAELSGDWKDVRWPLQDPATVESRQGSFRVAGSADDYRVEVTAEIYGPNIPRATVQLAGSGDTGHLTLTPSTAQTLNGEVTVEGTVAWSPALSWDARVQARDIDPAQQWPEWPGRLGWLATSDGRYEGKEGRAPELIANVQVERLDGSLRDYPVTVAGKAGLRGDRYTIDALEVSSGNARITANGEISDAWSLDWKVDAPDLANLLPDAAGALAAQGTLRGARATPTVAATIRGSGLRYTDLSVRTLEGDLDVDLADARASRVELSVTDAKVGDQVIPSAEVEARGKTAAHTLEARLVAEPVHAHVRLDGGWDGKRWNGQLARADIEPQAEGDTLQTWTLQRPARLTASASEAQWSGACWNAHNAQLCSAGEWKAAGGWKTDGRLERLSLQELKPLLPVGLNATGELSAKFQAQGDRERIAGALSTEPLAGALSYRTEDDELIQVEYGDAAVDIALADGTLRASARTALGAEGSLRAEARLSPIAPGKPLDQAKLSGTVNGELTELGLLTAFVPAVEETKGRIAIDATLAGTATAPRVDGSVLLTEAGARIPQLGITVKDLRLEVRATEAQALAIDGEAHSGTGVLRMAGTLDLDAARGRPLRLKITGENFEILNMPEARIVAQPDLDLALQHTDVTVEGTVTIPEADIRIREIPPSAVQVSRDVVIVDEGVAVEPATRWRITSRVTVRLGDKVHFRGFNLDSRFAGALRVVEVPGKATQADGVLNMVDAVYNAYGQKLTVSQGRLIFAGSLENPQLDAKAIRKEGEVTAGIQVSGPLRQPVISLFSTPSMDQGDILSYLMIGRPLNQASNAEGQLLMSAVSSLGVTGGDTLAKRIGGAFGFEEVRVESGATAEDTSLVVGKYLSPKLFISYGIGLFQPENLFRMRYQISRKLTLQAESGAQSGADLLYTIEYR